MNCHNQVVGWVTGAPRDPPHAWREATQQTAPNPAELIALVDGLSGGVLDPSQAAAVQALREGLLALTRVGLAKQNIGDVKELAVRKEEQRE